MLEIIKRANAKWFYHALDLIEFQRSDLQSIIIGPGKVCRPFGTGSYVEPMSAQCIHVYMRPKLQ